MNVKTIEVISDAVHGNPDYEQTRWPSIKQGASNSAKQIYLIMSGTQTKTIQPTTPVTHCTLLHSTK
jgi:hypothetical protein